MFKRIGNVFSVVFDAIFTQDPEVRNKKRFYLAAAIARKLGGYRLYKYSHSWPHDKEFLKIWRAYPESSNRIKDKRYVQYQLARSISTLPGDTAECGVYRGAGSYLILRATEGQNRLHHMFDSFQGLSKPESYDLPDEKEAHSWKAGELAIGLDVVKRNLINFDNLCFYKGWIPERFHEVAERRFAYVYIDVDLYKPTFDSLDFFYDRMVSGGLLVCDDYGFVDCPGAKKACDEFISDKPEKYIIHLSSGQGLIVKR
jgi:hypothetical protein